MPPSARFSAAKLFSDEVSDGITVRSANSAALIQRRNAAGGGAAFSTGKIGGGALAGVDETGGVSS